MGIQHRPILDAYIRSVDVNVDLIYESIYSIFVDGGVEILNLHIEIVDMRI